MRTYQEPSEPLISVDEKKKVEAALKALERVRSRAASEFKDKRVTWYLDGSETLCLMVEPVAQAEPWPEHIGFSARFKAASGGDW